MGNAAHMAGHWAVPAVDLRAALTLSGVSSGSRVGGGGARSPSPGDDCDSVACGEHLGLGWRGTGLQGDSLDVVLHLTQIEMGGPSSGDQGLICVRMGGSPSSASVWNAGLLELFQDGWPGPLGAQRPQWSLVGLL